MIEKWLKLMLTNATLVVYSGSDDNTVLEIAQHNQSHDTCKLCTLNFFYGMRFY